MSHNLSSVEVVMHNWMGQTIPFCSRVKKHFHLLTTDGRIDGQAHAAIIVHTCGSCNTA